MLARSPLAPVRRGKGHPGVLPPDDVLRRLLVEAESSGGLKALSRRLGVGQVRLQAAADRLGVSGRVRYLVGLPPDDVVARDIRAASTYAEVARRYGVRDYQIRNRGKALGVRPGDPEPPPSPPAPEPESPEVLRRRLADAEALLGVASDEIQDIERQRDEAVRREADQRAEVERLRAALAGPSEPPEPADIDAILAEAQATGAVVILPKAARAARKALDVDLARLRGGLLALRDAYVPYRRGEVSADAMRQALAAVGFEETGSLADPRKLRSLGYVATWQGEEVLLDRHLKYGIKSKRLIRVYFHYDTVAQVAVVGWLPDHLTIHGYS